ncbi:MAG: hypothetical protein ACK53K_11015 [Burkholderiales bacterium]
MRSFNFLNSFPHIFCFQNRGMSLIVILMLLMAITGVVMFSARLAVVGESSARNRVDYELARHAAEAALRDAERDLLLTEKPATAACSRDSYDYSQRFSTLYINQNCPQGQCSEQVQGVRDWADGTNAERWWPVTKNGWPTTPPVGGKWNGDNHTANHNFTPGCYFNGAVPLGSFTGATRIQGVERQPEYLIELFLSRDTPMARISARGFGMKGTETEVLLQSYILLPPIFP